MPDLNNEALEIWGALKPMIDQEIANKTQGMVQRRKAKVTTAPSLVTNTIGVTEAFGTEMFLPFVSNMISANVGDFVWIEWMYGATNAFVSSFAAVDDKDLTVAGDLTVNGDAEFNGVLDVTKRRCSATLSSAGWYRVIANSQAENRVLPGGLRGAILDMKITTSMDTNSESEEHEIILFQGTHEVSFMYELSSTSANQVIDKVRYTYKPSNDYGYVDIHFSASFDVNVTVYFAVSIDPTLQHTYVPDGLSAVAASPSGEIIIAEHNFHSNNYPVNVVEPTSLITSGTIAASGTMTYTATRPCWVYFTFVMQANSSGSVLVKINNVNIISWISGEAVPLNLSFLPIPLMKGDTIYVSQSSGRSSSYSIFAMR